MGQVARATSKRDSSTACPGASRKCKGAGHSAWNDAPFGEADSYSAPSMCAGHSMLPPQHAKAARWGPRCCAPTKKTRQQTA